MATGANWEFETGPAGRMGDYKSQSMPTGSTTVARAVAASSAFPVTFPLLRIKQRKQTAWLSDGGVYDNLGMEPVWKTHQIVLVSDAGQPLRQEPGYHHWQLRLPFVGWAARLNRVFEVVLNQVAAVRKRWFIAVLCSPNRSLNGTYWGIATDYQDYGLADGRGYPPAVVKLLKAVRTDLNAFSDGEIGCLANHGYALTDTALRRWLRNLLPGEIPPFNYPYPDFVDEQLATAALADSSSRTLWRDFWRWLWSGSTR
jgi:NTE family protein